MNKTKINTVIVKRPPANTEMEEKNEDEIKIDNNRKTRTDFLLSNKRN